MKQAARLRHLLSLLMHGEAGGLVPSAEKTLQDILELFGGEAGGPHPPSAEHTLVAIRDLLEGGVGATAAEVWAEATRTLTDISAEEIFDLPIFDSHAPSDRAEPVSAAGADNFGGWVELIADVGAGKRLMAVGFCCTSGAVLGGLEIELGEGAGGAEAAVARFGTGVSRVDLAPPIVYLWKSLTDNARLSVRARDNHANPITYAIMPHIA